MARKVIALASGGLDSLLAIAIASRMGLEVIAYHAYNLFSPESDTEEKREELRGKLLAAGAGDVVFKDRTRDMIEFTKSPKFGYGKNLNACIDCRLLTILGGKELMEERGASFIVSGEVIGQRPMSQRKEAINMVDRQVREMGLEGLLVRPLSAKLLEPTIPEKEGWIDREKLYDFSGRNRKPQIALAKDLGVADYPNPGGGCLLTDPCFADRLRDVMEWDSDWGEYDVALLRVGKHFRIAENVKLVVSRREEENRLLTSLVAEDEFLFITKDKPGGIVLLHGKATPETEVLAAGLAVQHSKFRDEGEGPVWKWTKANGFAAGVDYGVAKRVRTDEVPRPQRG